VAPKVKNLNGVVILIKELLELVAPKLDHQVTDELAKALVEVKFRAPDTELDAVTSHPGTSLLTRML
jgi:hypothetical protein